MSCYAYGIKNGRMEQWVVNANKRHQARLDAGEICAACGLTFGMNSNLGRVQMSLHKPDICTHCEAALG
jgi:hypothetical protein